MILKSQCQNGWVIPASDTSEGGTREWYSAVDGRPMVFKVYVHHSDVNRKVLRVKDVIKDEGYDKNTLSECELANELYRKSPSFFVDCLWPLNLSLESTNDDRLAYVGFSYAGAPLDRNALFCSSSGRRMRHRLILKAPELLEVLLRPPAVAHTDIRIEQFLIGDKGVLRLVDYGSVVNCSEGCTKEEKVGVHRSCDRHGPELFTNDDVIYALSLSYRLYLADTLQLCSDSGEMTVPYDLQLFLFAAVCEDPRKLKPSKLVAKTLSPEFVNYLTRLSRIVEIGRTFTDSKSAVQEQHQMIADLLQTSAYLSLVADAIAEDQILISEKAEQNANPL